MQKENNQDIEETLFIPDDVDPIDDFNPEDEVPFDIIEAAPIFLGCKGTNSQRKACFLFKLINS